MSKPGIVIAHWDKLPAFDDLALDRLDQVGRLLDRSPVTRWDDPRAGALLAEAEILVGHWGCPPLDRTLFRLAPRLKLFAYAAGTVKGCLTDEVWQRGLVVTSGADANAEPVAEYTLAMILLANKAVLPAVHHERGGGAWTPPGGAGPVGNWDKTIGIVSASLIGRRVAELLCSFPHLRVEIYDPFVDASTIESLGAAKVDDLSQLCRQADVLSIHLPALPDTHNLVGAPELALLRDGATVINTSRGHCLDLDALVTELERGRLAAVIDVTDPIEPLPPDHPLRSLPNAALTPHLAGSTGTELGRMSDWLCDEVERFISGRPQRNRVTRDTIEHLA